ncbi:S8 family serine peptidase [Petroclostridium sp. X23]|uniref:S8 family serine peptidase n=1 Tax=Petroclostridium sp. X23 TaxID=3045146 RepID=UPI0024AD47B5|nr:S8 family serine peptidase [Petroclostridium sp. X23]WHH57908.1 S8 family serine peptidase [Petroclostridium sp. X23]
MDKHIRIFMKAGISIFFLFILNILVPNNGIEAADDTYSNHMASVERKNEILVKYKNRSNMDTDKNSIMDKMSLPNVKLKKRFNKFGIDLFEIVDDDNAEIVFKQFSENPEIEFIQPNYKLNKFDTLQDEFSGEQWGIKNTGQVIQGLTGVAGIDVNVVPVWDITIGSEDVVVGVIDSDIDVYHSDLAYNIYVNPGEILGNGIDDDQNGYIDDIMGWDFYNNDNTAYDFYLQEKHGTQVAGIISASINSEGIQGVAPGVKILPLKFIQGDGGYTSDVIAAIEYAKTMGVRIVNCSWGGEDYNLALAQVMADSDMLFICATGNNGYNLDVSPVYPASFDLPNVLSVAAINNQGALASFSNYGSTVDIAAPGVGIFSTFPERGYGFNSGTSFAAPFISGVAALLKSVKHDIGYNEIIQLIDNHVKVLPSLGGKVMTSGMADAYETVKALQAAQILYGDVNVDNIISAGDATLVLRDIVGLTSLSQEQKKAADVNGDGSITAGDATVILRYVVGLISEFPIEKQ